MTAGRASGLSGTAARPFGVTRPSTVRPLGAAEARRMLRHPANAVALAATVVAVATIIFSGESTQRHPTTIAHAALFLLVAMFYPLATVVAANRVAGATSRRSVREAMTVTPTQARRRTMAMCLGGLTGPAVVGVGIMLLAFVVGPFVPDGDGMAARTLLELLQIPATVLGAGLLGVALARWVAFPGVLALVVMALWFGHFAVATTLSADGAVVHGPAWLGLMPTWLFSDQSMAARSPLPQEMWHLVYLAGLALLAGVAALLHAPGRRRPLLLAGAGIAVLTGVAAVLQLG